MTSSETGHDSLMRRSTQLLSRENIRGPEWRLNQIELDLHRHQLFIGRVRRVVRNLPDGRAFPEAPASGLSAALPLVGSRLLALEVGLCPVEVRLDRSAFPLRVPSTACPRWAPASIQRPLRWCSSCRFSALSISAGLFELPLELSDLGFRSLRFSIQSLDSGNRRA